MPEDKVRKEIQEAFSVAIDCVQQAFIQINRAQAVGKSEMVGRPIWAVEGREDLRPPILPEGTDVAVATMGMPGGLTEATKLVMEIPEMIKGLREGFHSVDEVAKFTTTLVRSGGGSTKGAFEVARGATEIAKTAGTTLGSGGARVLSVTATGVPIAGAIASGAGLVLAIIDVVKREKRETAGMAFFLMITQIAEQQSRTELLGPTSSQSEANWKAQLNATSGYMAPIYWFNFKYRSGILTKIRMYTETVGLAGIAFVGAILTILAVTLAASTLGFGGAIIGLTVTAAGIGYGMYRFGKYVQSVNEFEIYIRENNPDPKLLNVLYSFLSPTHRFASALLPTRFMTWQGRGTTLGDWFRFQLAQRLSNAYWKNSLNMDTDATAESVASGIDAHAGRPSRSMSDLYNMLDFIYFCRTAIQDCSEYGAMKEFATAFLIMHCLYRGSLPARLPSEREINQWMQFAQSKRGLGLEFAFLYSCGPYPTRSEDFEQFLQNAQRSYTMYWTQFDDWAQKRATPFSGPYPELFPVAGKGPQGPKTLGDAFYMLPVRKYSVNPERIYADLQEELLMVGVWEIIKLESPANWRAACAKLHPYDQIQQITLTSAAGVTLQRGQNILGTRMVTERQKNQAYWENAKIFFELIKKNR